MEGVRLPREAAGVEREEQGEQRGQHERAALQGALRRTGERIEHQRDADVLALLQRVRECEEAGAGHHVAGIGADAGQVEVELAAHDGEHHHHQQRHHEHRRQRGRAAVQGVEQPAKRGGWPDSLHHIFL